MSEPTALNDLTQAALDAAYRKTAGPLLAQIQALTTARGAALQKALSGLDDEAARLEADDQRMSGDNASLEQALRAHRATLDTSAALIRANDNALQESAQALAIPSVTAKVFLGITAALIAAGKNPLTALPEYAKQTAGQGIKWVLPKAVDFARNYVESDAWIARMDKWGEGYADLTHDIILKGIADGHGPKRIAQLMRQHAEGLPYRAAESLTRTLQLTAYRDASVAMEALNGGYILKKIRIATLNESTCLSCIALHGTELEPGQRVDDHFRGRCSEFYRVPGGAAFPSQMQADSRPGKRAFVPWQTGEEWFKSLPPERQAQQASMRLNPAKLKAYRAGAPLSAFVGDHDDSVFGHQVVETSLIKALGDQANQYYTRSK